MKCEPCSHDIRLRYCRDCPPLGMSPSDRIQQLLSHKPGLKAQQIAGELGLERSQVIAALHDLTTVAQDNAYRWWPKARGPQSGAPATRRTFLANLCRYYLECLSRESGPAISLLAADKSNYVVLNELPFAPQPFALQGEESAANTRAIKKLVQRVRRERGQLALFVGYALRMRVVRQRQEEEMRIEPLLLYPLEEISDEGGEPLRPVSGIPLFNLEVLKNLPSADSGNLIDEAIQLSEELGLANHGRRSAAMGRDYPAPPAPAARVDMARGPQSLGALSRAAP